MAVICTKSDDVHKKESMTFSLFLFLILKLTQAMKHFQITT